MDRGRHCPQPGSVRLPGALAEGRGACGCSRREGCRGVATERGHGGLTPPMSLERLIGVPSAKS